MSVHLGFYSILLLWLIQTAAVASEEARKFGCRSTCGDVYISYPFGFEAGCYTNSWFRVTCNKTAHGLKPYLSRINMELIPWYSIGSGAETGSVKINSPVTYVNCSSGKDDNGAAFSVHITGSPFVFSKSNNVFGSVGCGNLVTIFRNQNDPISGIVQPRCGEEAVKGVSLAQTYENMPFSTETNWTSYTATLTKIYPGHYMDNKRCSSSVFMFDKSMLDRDLAFPNDIDINTKHVRATLEWGPFECDLGATLCRKLGPAAYNSICTERCGDVNITYPFGMAAGCYMNDWFRISCNETASGPKPFIRTRSNDLQVLSFSFTEGKVTINNSVTYFNCPSKDNNDGVSINLTGSPFFLSNIYNRFLSIGCDNVATISDIGGCLQPRCSDVTISNGSCLMAIPPGLSSFSADMTGGYPSNGRNRSCGSAFMIELDSLIYETSTLDLDQRHVPTALEWATPKGGLCELNEGLKTFCSPDGEYCWANLSSTHLCVCYKGNYRDPAVDVCESTYLWMSSCILLFRSFKLVS